MSHTPEPIITMIDGNGVFKVLHNGTDWHEDQHDSTLERLSACYNNCEGINPEALPLIMEALEYSKNLLEPKIINFLLLNGFPKALAALPRLEAALAKAKETK